MTKAEAAAAWAEAKEALDVAQASMTKALESYKAASSAEKSAWEALQAIAGRKDEPRVVPMSVFTTLPTQVVVGHTQSDGPKRGLWQEQTVPIPPKVVG